MKTTRLYQNDVDLRNWNATITFVERRDNMATLILDKTAFFPEGGGQSCDLGTISCFRVVDVQESEENIIHTISIEDSNINSFDASCLSGSDVSCSLDWEHRFENMQRHCGEHILSGVFYNHWKCHNRGFHIGDDYMTIDIFCDDASAIDSMTEEIIREAELAANKIIWSDEPVVASYFNSGEEASRMPLRKALEFNEDISVITIGPVDKPLDCVACCGTHPTSTGQVGLLKIYKVEKNKDMFRVYFDAGSKALEDYCLKHSIISSLSDRYSSSVVDFPSKLTAQENKYKQTKQQLVSLKRVLIAHQQELLDEAIEASQQKSLLYRVEHLSLDDVFDMAKPYMKKSPQLLMLYSVDDTSFILASDGNIPCGDLVKEYASFYNGKGGGNQTSARGIFESEEDAMLFADLVAKHLR